MNFDLKMRPARITVETDEMAVGGLLALAEKCGAEAHILAQSPRKVIFERFHADLPAAEFKECSQIVIFGPEAELRMEKDYGAMSGICRSINENGAGGKECLARETSYILHDHKLKGRLRYAEYFEKDEKSGFLRLACGRLCGITKGN